MAITAQRIGQSGLTWDWGNLTKNAIDPITLGEVKAAWEKLSARFKSGEIGFFDAPTSDTISAFAHTQTLAQTLRESGKFKDCLFLGIGGSSLGPISLLSSLEDRKTKGAMKLHFIENPDALDWKSTLSKLDPETTLIVCVTKSGTTYETLAQFILALEWLGRSRLKSHVVCLTDPKKGDLRLLVEDQKLYSLPIHPSLGGRFSIFSPVGLFAAELTGLSGKNFLEGANEVRSFIEKTPIEKNPIFITAAEFISRAETFPTHVCMPYSTRLRLFGNWFVQLWGESLGKNGKGFTPIAAVGATDQHSILQLLRDGPNDKITIFLRVEKVDDECAIPKESSVAPLSAYPAFQILMGHSLHELLNIEYAAISRVLTNQSRPNLTIRLDALTEKEMGGLYFAFAVMTALTGTLWDVNPFDQPGVEEGKVYINESLKNLSELN